METYRGYAAGLSPICLHVGEGGRSGKREGGGVGAGAAAGVEGGDRRDVGFRELEVEDVAVLADAGRVS